MGVDEEACEEDSGNCSAPDVMNKRLGLSLKLDGDG